jgi:hypothetical protein
MQSAFRQQLLGICKINETKTVPPALYNVNEAAPPPMPPAPGAAAPAASGAPAAPPDPKAIAAIITTMKGLENFMLKDGSSLLKASPLAIATALNNMVPQMKVITDYLKATYANSPGAKELNPAAIPSSLISEITKAEEAKKKAAETAAKAPPAPPAPPTQKPGTTGTAPAPGANQPAAASAAAVKPGAPPAPQVAAAK